MPLTVRSFGDPPVPPQVKNPAGKPSVSAVPSGGSVDTPGYMSAPLDVPNVALAAMSESELTRYTRTLTLLAPLVLAQAYVAVRGRNIELEAAVKHLEEASKIQGKKLAAEAEKTDALRGVVITLSNSQLKDLHESGVPNPGLENMLNGLKDVLKSPRKNSRTSSSKPSSDDPKTQAERTQAGKKKSDPPGKPGPKKGHPPNNRPPLEEKDADRVEVCLLPVNECPVCRGEMVERPECDKSRELLEIPLKVIESIFVRRRAYYCPDCKCMHYADEPDDMPQGLMGNRLKALITSLKIDGSMSTSKIKVVAAALGGKFSRGAIDGVLDDVAAAVEEPCEELVRKLPTEDSVNVDESQLKKNGKMQWVWVFVASAFTVFHVAASRGSDVLVKILTDDFRGVVGSDFFSAYLKFVKEHPEMEHQVCLAHFIRRLNNLNENYTGERRTYGLKLLELLARVFELHHQLQEEFNLNTLHQLLKAAFAFRDYATTQVPRDCTDPSKEDKLCRPVAKRIRERFESHFLFILLRYIGPTNNLAEQAIRHLVIDRHVTFGVRSDRGARRKANLMTVRATCCQRRINFFQYVNDCLVAKCKGMKAPSMLSD
jgi:transposase